MTHYKSIIRILTIIFISAMALTSCADANAEPDGDITGYPVGQIQRELVFYAGHIWGLDFYNDSMDGRELDSLPDEYVLVGKTLGDDPYNVPTEEFHTSQLSEGIEIWAIPENYENICLKFPDHGFRRFIPTTEY